MKHFIFIFFIIPILSFSSVINSTFDLNSFEPISNAKVKIIDISLNIEDALMGGMKASCSATIKNGNSEDVNYTLYVIAFDSQNNIICSFSLEPLFNIHEAGKTETLSASGLTDIKSTSSIKKITTKFIVQ